MTEKIHLGARIGLTTVLLLVLALAGVQSNAQAPLPTPLTGAPGPDYVCDYPPAPSADGGQSMTPDGNPYIPSARHLILPLMFKTDTGGKRSALLDKVCFAGQVVTFADADKDVVRGSVAEVASHVGRQFTLIGAKPSGTG